MSAGAGMIITFSGVDGTGKSTQARYVAELLTQKGVSVRVLHLTRWTWVFRIGERFGTLTTSGRSPSGLKRSGAVQSAFRQLVMLLDVARFWLVVGLDKNRALVCDRYFSDLAIHAVYLGHVSTRFATLYWRLVPRPSLAFLLDVDEQTARTRECSEHSTAYYAEKRSLYSRFHPPWPHVYLQTNDLRQTQATLREQIEKVLR